MEPKVSEDVPAIEEEVVPSKLIVLVPPAVTTPLLIQLPYTSKLFPELIVNDAAGRAAVTAVEALEAETVKLLHAAPGALITGINCGLELGISASIVELGTPDPHQFEAVNQSLLVAPIHVDKEAGDAVVENVTVNPEPPPP